MSSLNLREAYFTRTSVFQFARGGRNPVGDKKLLLLVEFRGPKSYRRAVQVSEEALPAWHGANRASFRARAPRVAGSLYRPKNGDSSESNRRWYLQTPTGEKMGKNRP